MSDIDPDVGSFDRPSPLTTLTESAARFGGPEPVQRAVGLGPDADV